MEDKLVGEWQSSKPESIHFKIEKKGNYASDFHNGFSFSVNDGTTYTQYWCIGNSELGTMLYRSSGGPGGMGLNDPHLMNTFSSANKIIDLTSDRLVLEWFVNNEKRVVEFKRVK